MCRLVVLAVLLAWLGPALAAEPVLTVRFGDQTHRLTAAELLARPDARTITVEDKDAYRRPMAYQAVPLLRGGAQGGPGGGAVPWLAVEPPDRPWPVLPGKNMTTGPFYVVWQNPERSGVAPEQWPYAVAALEGVESPAHRWPRLRLDASVPADAPARRGQEVFVTFCLACHRLDGGGGATMGPDLGRPMSPTRYLTEPGLRALIRDPKSVRTWPEQHMPGFDAATLPEADLDAVIAYLRAKAAK